MINQLFFSLLEVSFSVSLIVIVISLFSKRLNRRYSSKWKYWLWIVLAVRLLIPINYNFTKQQINLNIPDVVLTNAENLSDVSNSVQEKGEGIRVVWNNSVEEENVSLLQILCYVWMLGAIAYFTVHIFIYMQFYMKVIKQGRRIEDDAIQNEIKKLTADMGIYKQVLPLIGPFVSSPMILGFRKTVLILPDIRYTPEEVTFILKHEFTHVKRHDVYYKLLLLLSNSLHWFNPAVYILVKEANTDLELSCDSEVVKKASLQQRKAYTETIYATIQKQCGRNSMLSTQFYGGNKIMKQRFANILGRQKRKNGFLMFAAICALTLILGSLVGCSPKKQVEEKTMEQGEDTKQGKETEKTLESEFIEKDNAVKENENQATQEEKTGISEGLSADALEIQKIVEEFSKSYFEADIEAMKAYLTEPYEWSIDTYSNTGEKVSIADASMKGLNDIKEKEINDVVEVWLEFKNSVEEDSYQYLTFEMVKQEEGWKISFYGLEG